MSSVEVRKCWQKLVGLLDIADQAREPPLAPLVTAQGTAHFDRGKALHDMREQATTRDYRSGHRWPLVWQLRVDEGQVFGLAFLELAVQIPDGSPTHQTASLRVVNGITHPGWVLEGRGHMTGWKSGETLFNKFAKDDVTTSRSSTFTPLHEDVVARAIVELVQEADRIEELLTKILIGA